MNRIFVYVFCLNALIIAQTEFRYYLEDAKKADQIDFELSQFLDETNISLTKQNLLLEAKMNNKELVYILTILSIYEANKNISNNNKCVSTEALSKVMISEWRQELKEKILTSIGHYRLIKRSSFGKDYELIDNYQKFANELLERYKT